MNFFQKQAQQPQNPMMARFQQFAQSFHGNAQQEVQNLLNSGRMSQQQFNQLREMAQQMFGIKF